MRRLHLPSKLLAAITKFAYGLLARDNHFSTGVGGPQELFVVSV